MSRDNTKDPTPNAVYCRGDSVPGFNCGLVFLTDAQYAQQLASPNSSWFCPNCGSSARWDDYCQTTNPPEDEA